MNVKDPGTLFLAWLVVPALIVLASACIGAAVGAACSLRLGLLVIPTGFLTGIVVMTAALRLGLSGKAAVAAALVAALPGAVVLARDLRASSGWLGPLRDGGVWAAVAGVAAYAVALAPLVGSGRSGILGYVLNNDPSVHIVMIDWLIDHGAAGIAEPDSSYASAADLASTGYPLGGHVWVVFAGLLTGVDVFHLWSPLMAVGAVMLALSAVAVVRSLGAAPPLAAGAGVLVACGYLPYSFVAEGGFKEIAVAAALLAFAALFGRAVEAGLSVRRLIPALLVAAGASATFSLAAGAWFAPAAAIALGWLLVVRRRERGGRLLPRPGVGLALAAGAVAVAVPVLITAADYLGSQRSIFQRADQVGNLIAPVPFREAFGVWFGHDYRYPTPVEPLLTDIAVVVLALLTALGFVVLLARRRPTAVLALVAGVAGTAAISIASKSIYYELKAYVVIAPVLGIAAVGALLWLWERGRRLRMPVAVLAVLLGAGVLVSDAMVYAGAWVTPKERLAGLVQAGGHVPRGGPVLVDDREYYAKYLLRHLKPWNSWEEWQPFRGFNAGEIPPKPPRNPDLDDYRDSLMARFPAIIERRRPGGSRPPGNYEQVFENRWYRVWRRSGPAPQIHLGVALGTVSGSGRLDCDRRAWRQFAGAVRRRGEGTLRVAPADRPPLISPTYGWKGADVLEAGPAEFFLKRRGGKGFAFAPLRKGRRYRIWIQGAFGPGVRVLIGERPLGDAFGDQEQFDGWHLIGEIDSETNGVTFAIRGLPRAWWLAGSHWNDLTGPLAFEEVESRPALRELPASSLRSLCGQRLDWVELV